MPTVFITQQTEHNITAAAGFGAFRYLAHTPLHQPIDTLEALSEMRMNLAGFTDDDYLMCIGNPVLIGLACTVAARVNKGRYKLLVWDRYNRLYNSLSVDMGE